MDYVIPTVTLSRFVLPPSPQSSASCPDLALADVYSPVPSPGILAPLETLCIVVPIGSPSVIILLPPQTYGPSAAICSSTPMATVGSSFPSALPLSSVTPAPPQSSSTLAPPPMLVNAESSRSPVPGPVSSALHLCMWIYWPRLLQSPPNCHQPVHHLGSSLNSAVGCYYCWSLGLCHRAVSLGCSLPLGNHRCPPITIPSPHLATILSLQPLTISSPSPRPPPKPLPSVPLLFFYDT
ncbi:hypothetical protein M9458_043062, partial [Cirrhinus mrigala]